MTSARQPSSSQASDGVGPGTRERAGGTRMDLPVKGTKRVRLLQVPLLQSDAGRTGSRLLVYFAGTPWDGNRGTDQHVAQRLTEHLPVLYVDPPRSALRAVRGGGLAALRPRLEQIGDGLHRLTPVAPPGPLRAGVRHITSTVLRRTALLAVAHLSSQVDVVVAAGFSPSLDILPAGLRVLYGTDDFVAGAELMGVSRAWTERRERAQLDRADLVIAVSEPLAARWRSLGRSTSVVENGCDADFFAGAGKAPVPDDVHLPPPVAGVVGQLSDRLDLSMLEAVADHGDSLLLVGPRVRALADERFDRLIERPNVQWVGAKPFAELPSYLGVMQVGLVPYTDTVFNRASFPLKTLEYLAAGRAVVATDLPAMRRLPADVVVLASAPGEYATAVHAALHAEPDAGASARRRAVAVANSWDVRSRHLARLMGLVEDPHTGSRHERSGPPAPTPHPTV